MGKKIQIIAIVGVMIFSVFVLTSPTDPIPLPDPTINSENDSVKILAENLKKPRAIAVADDRIFVTEQDGQIRIIENNILLDSPLATFRTADVFDGGLIGIAVHPDFNNNHFVYVFLTYQENGNLWNKIIQITESENKLQDASVTEAKILDGSITATKILNGSILNIKIADGTIDSPLLLDLDDHVILANDEFVRVNTFTKSATLNFAKGKKSISSREMRDKDVKELLDILEANVYEDTSKDIDKKLIKEIIKKYEII